MVLAAALLLSAAIVFHGLCTLARGTGDSPLEAILQALPSRGRKSVPREPTIGL